MNGVSMNHHVNIDLHIHTQRYSPCAETLDPTQLAKYMQLCNVHGVVLAEHNELWKDEEITELRNQFPEVNFFRGVEISCEEGHFVVIGLQSLKDIPRRPSIHTVIHATREFNPAVIWVHPFLHYSPEAMSTHFMALPDEINAVEVYSTMTWGKYWKQAMNYASQRNWSIVAGSDAHCLENIGATYTEFDFLPQSEEDLAHAIQSGLGKPRSNGIQLD